MAVFFHTGGTFTGFTALSMTTFDTILDSIIADVQAAVTAGTNNGWTVFDDQRTPAGTVVVPVSWGSHIYMSGSSSNIFVNASTAVAATPTYTVGRFLRRWIPGVTEVNISTGSPDWTPTGTWTTVSAIASDTNATLATAWASATVGTYSAADTYRKMVEKAFGYIVLRCQSAQKVFYVRLIRPKSYGDALRYDVWETWNSATHTGTGPSNQEIIRAYDSKFTGAKPLQYILWLMPDALGLWAGGDPGNITGGTYWDFMYAGNLSPVRPNDSNALVHACTNQELSGWGGGTEASPNSGYTSDGGMQVLRDVGGANMWVNNSAPVFTPVNAIAVFSPRAPIYAEDAYRPLLDDTNRLAMSEVDVYQAGGRGYGSLNEGRRGSMRYLRVPCGNPSNNNLVTFGPAEDGKVYVLFRSTQAWQRPNSATALAADILLGSNTPPTSGFSWGYRTQSYGDVAANGTGFAIHARYFLLPVEV